MKHTVKSTKPWPSISAVVAFSNLTSFCTREITKPLGHNTFKKMISLCKQKKLIAFSGLSLCLLHYLTDLEQYRACFLTISLPATHSLIDGVNYCSFHYAWLCFYSKNHISSSPIEFDSKLSIKWNGKCS